jgi:hypothetical protein
MCCVIRYTFFNERGGGVLPSGVEFMQGVSESSCTVIVVTSSVKEDEREGQGHTSASLLHQSAT